MKREKVTLKTKMFYLLVIALVGGGLYGLTQVGSTTTATNEPTEEVVEVVEVIEVDVLDEAQEALDKANLLLDAEETKLLEERAVIDSRLEQIIEKRTSF